MAILNCVSVIKDDKALQEIAETLGEKLTTAKRFALTEDIDKVVERSGLVQLV